MFGTWIKEITDLVIPAVATCQLCGSRRKPGKYAGLCCICQKELDYWEEKYHQCDICGRYIAGGVVCPVCSEKKPPFSMATAVGPYRGILKESLCSLKFRGDRKLSVPLGKLLAQKIRFRVNVEDMDLIIPVPLHKDKLQGRGFNQAELIAREVSREIRKPVANRILIKKRDTTSQTHLSQKEREANLKNAFYVMDRSRIQGAVILLVDDILTTGSTVSECTRELLKWGGEKIFVATVATGIHFYPTE